MLGLVVTVSAISNSSTKPLQSLVADDVAYDSFAGRTPLKRIVYDETGECAGTFFTDSSFEGGCDSRTVHLPTIRYYELFPLDRVALD
jgi:hypothetical protein